MNFTESILQYQNTDIHYHIGGEGEKVLLAFNGFANSAEELMPLFRQFRQHRVIIIDLPGYSDWHKAVVGRKDLVGIADAFCEKLNVRQFSLLGYSLGAKICLNITEQIPDRINSIILLAPDGLQHNFWYKTAVRNPLGKWLFKRITDKPSAFLSVVSFLEKIKLISTAEKKLIFYNLEDASLRRQLYETWNLLGPLMHNIENTKHQINRHNLSLLIIAGKKDYIFPAKLAYKFSRDIKHSEVLTIEAGHNFLKAKEIELLSEIIQQVLEE